MSLKKCPMCDENMGSNDPRCPNCDYLNTSSINTFIFAFSAATIIIFAVFGVWIWQH